MIIDWKNIKNHALFFTQIYEEVKGEPNEEL